MLTLEKINYGILFSCIVGLLLSFYAYKVETSLEMDKKYEAMCDISEHVSCSKVFMSEYGKGFGIFISLLGEESILSQPNSVYGIIFYSLIILLSQLNNVQITKFVIALNTLSNILSIYLAFILYLLEDICVVCVTTYIVNFVNLILSVIKLQKIKHTKYVKKAQ